MQISKHFSFREFEHSDTAEKAGIKNVISTSEIRDNITALVLNILQPLRNQWSKPMKINSGYRSPQLNKLVGGVPTSQHTKGEAADIKTGNEATSFELASLALKMNLPYDQMILYPTFVHFSHKRGKNRKQILYNRKYRGQRL